MKMKTGRMSMTIMSAGVVCLLLYTLLALWKPVTFDMGAGKILFYAGVITLPLGVILLLTGEMKRRSD
jgi:uncharacterized integral membrane protein